MKESGWLDTRLYDDVFLLAYILCYMSGQLTESEKEKLKNKFLKKVDSKDKLGNVITTTDEINAEVDKILEVQDDSPTANPA